MTVSKSPAGADKASASAGFIVAPGRSIVTDKGPFGPGDVVEIDPAEGARLRKAGFFLDEKGEVVVNASGPATSSGSEIKES